MDFRMMTAAVSLLLLGGCTIADVTVPDSEDRLVVEAVLRTDALRQTILLHRSVRAQSSVGEPGAEVVITGPGGREISFSLTDEPCYLADPVHHESEITVEASCYRSGVEAGYWVVPGETYDLRVRTTRGELARARTTVPGAYRVNGIATSRRNDVPEPVCTLPPQTPLALSWTPSPGAWGYLSPLTIYGLRGAYPVDYEAPDPLELVGVSVSAADTTIVLPGEFGVFDRFEYSQGLLLALQTGLPPLAEARVVIAAADRNYINAVRGGNFNPSGQVRISSIAGDGVGVFGSINAQRFVIKVGHAALAGQPPCGGFAG